jgi:hypothetical protein
MAASVEELLRMSPNELDELFRGSESGEIPQGEGKGTVLVRPGTELAGPAAKVVHYLVWQGKVFDPEHGELRNEILPFGVKSIRAKVYRDTSWFDQAEAIILDYSHTSLVAHWIRDEIRTVGPGTYLGLVYWDHARLLHFALEFPA